MWLADPGAGAGVLTLSVNTGLQSENGDTHLDCETGPSSQIYNLYWVGLKLWCMRSFPLRAEFSQDWVCCKLNKFCVPWSSDQGGGMMCDETRSPESPECQTFTIFTARETSSSVHTTHSHNRRMLASKIWCQDSQNIWPKDSERIFRMPFPPKVHPFSAHIFCSPGYQRVDSYDRNITPGLQLSAKWIWG